MDKKSEKEEAAEMKKRIVLGEEPDFETLTKQMEEVSLKSEKKGVAEQKREAVRDDPVPLAPKIPSEEKPEPLRNWKDDSYANFSLAMLRLFLHLHAWSIMLSYHMCFVCQFVEDMRTSWMSWMMWEKRPFAR